MVHKVTAALAAAILLLLSIGCGGNEKKVAVEKKTAFPESRYLTAEGSGQNEQAARRRALAELSGIFESKVHAETTSYARSAIGPETGELFEKNVESKVAVVSSVRLKGARIGRVWQVEGDPDAHHALAVIDRLQAGRDWAAELETGQAQIAAQVKSLENVQGRFSRIVVLNKIFSGLLRSQALESRLRVLNYPARETLDVDIAEIVAELAQLRTQLRLFVEMSGDGQQVAADRIADALTANGFMLSDGRDTADAMIGGNIETQPLELNNPRAKFVRATATVRVVETGTGATVAALNENIRKGHVDQTEAGRQAVLALADLLAERLVAELGFAVPPVK